MRLMKCFEKLAFPAAGLVLSTALTGSSLLDDKEEQPIINLPQTPYIILGDIKEGTAENFDIALTKLKLRAGRNQDITIIFNSNGGTVNEGWDILNTLEKSYMDGYNINLVCTKAFSMAGVIFASYSGPRWAEEGCQFMTHAAYIREESEPVYIKLPPIYLPDLLTVTLRDIMILNNSGITPDDNYAPMPFISHDFDITFKIPTSDLKKIDLDYEGITEPEKELLEQTQAEFANLLATRSCYITDEDAYDYFQTSDLYLSPFEMLQDNIIDDVVRLNANGEYKVISDIAEYKPDCAKQTYDIYKPAEFLQGAMLRPSFN